jgi:hypothetical protein
MMMSSPASAPEKGPTRVVHGRHANVSYCSAMFVPQLLMGIVIRPGSQNWSSGKKAWFMFQTYLLMFTIYVGSAIYTAGIPFISAEFHVTVLLQQLAYSLCRGLWTRLVKTYVCFCFVFQLNKHLQVRWFGFP